MNLPQSDLLNEMLQKVRGEIQRWQAVETALLSGVQAESAIHSETVKPKQKKVGRGMLRQAILSSGAKKLTNREFLERLQQKGYTHPLRIESLRTTLENLVGKGITREKSKDGIRYSVG